jgi:hypothetical protein
LLYLAIPEKGLAAGGQQLATTKDLMRETQWIEWTRTRLLPPERQQLLMALTSEQKDHLLEHDYVRVEGTGVLWIPSDGDLLRRARFTHGTYFQTQRGEFYIDSEGNTRELLNHNRTEHPAPTAPPPSSSGATGSYDAI